MNTAENDILSALCRVELFRTLCQDNELEQIASLAIIRRIPVGKAVYRIGELGGAVYVVFSGSVELVGRNGKGDEFLLSVSLPDELFGDEALAESSIRKSDAFAGPGTVLLEIPVAGLQKVLGESQKRWMKVREFAASRDLQRAVRQFSVLGNLSSDEIRRWFAACEMVTYEAGQVVVRKGDKGGQFYIIAAGRLGVFDSAKAVESSRLRTLSSGEFFGELEVLGGGVRTATVAAESQVVLAVFDGDGLKSAFANSPELKAHIMEVVAKYRGQVTPIAHPPNTPSQASEIKPSDDTPPIGETSYGTARNPGFWVALQILVSRMGPTLASYKGQLGKAFFLSLALAVALLISPKFNGLIMDIVSGKTGNQWGWLVLGGFLILVATKALFTYLREMALNRLRTGASQKFIGGLVRRVYSLPLDFLRRSSIGGVMQMLGRAESVQSALGDRVVSLLVDSLTLSIGLIWLFLLDARMAAMATLIVIPLVVFLSLLNGPRMRRSEEKFRKNIQEEKQMLAESVEAVATIKSMGAEQSVWQQWKERYEETLEAQAGMNLARVSSRTLGDIASGASMACLFYAAISLTGDGHSGQMSAGKFMEFLTRLMLIFQPLDSIVRTYPEMQEFAGGVLAMDQLIAQKTEEEQQASKPLPLPEGKWDLSFEGVTFGYSTSGRPAVQNITWKATAGQLVAIVGRSGCGKTTLVNLLLRFYTPQSGRILVNGTNISDLNLVSYRQHMGVVLQESQLLSRTIGENICLPLSSPDLEQAKAAARMAAAHRFIEEKSHGYNEPLIENGRNLSGGERQRIAIARALISNPRLLIFDEATAALDNESERAIQQNMKSMAEDRVMIVIAHRLSTIRSADLILVMDQGQIIETGTHHELMEKGGLYLHLLQQSMS